MICPSCRAALRAPRILRGAMRPLSVAALQQPPRALRSQASASPAPLRLFSSSRALRSALPAAADEAEDVEGSMTPTERSIAALLTSKLEPTYVLVQDVSGGCGSMYAIQIASPLFRGQTLLKQQRMVNAALGDVVKTWHGVQIRTVVSPEEQP